MVWPKICLAFGTGHDWLGIGPQFKALNRGSYLYLSFPRKEHVAVRSLQEQ